MTRLGLTMFWAFLLGVVPAQAAPGSLAFLGVYDAVESDPAAIRLLEADVSNRLTGWGELTIRLPSELDHEIGRATRIVMLSSRTPTGLLVDNAKGLNSSYALRLSYRERGEVLTAWTLPDGAELWSETVGHGEAHAALDRLRHRINEREAKLNAQTQEAVLREVGIGPGAAKKPALKLTHTPLTHLAPNVPATIEATIECQCDYEALVHYRRAGTSNWLTANLVAMGEGHHYVAGLAPMPAGKLEYYITVLDNDLEQLGGNGSQDQPHVVAIEAPVVKPPPVSAAIPPLTSPTAPVATPPVKATPVASAPATTTSATTTSATTPAETVPVKPLTLVPSNPVAPTSGTGTPVVNPRVTSPSRTGWLVAGSGGALLVGTVILAVLGQQQKSHIQNGDLATGADIERAAQLNQTFNVAALTSGVVGALVTGWGTKLLLTHQESAP